MELSAGYQLTELGLIRNDWKISQVQDVCRLVNGRGFKPFEWSTQGLPIIRIQNLNGSGDFNFYNGDYDKKIEILTGQLLFAWSGSRGTSFGPHFWSGTKGVLNYHTWKVVVDEQAVDSKFFFYALKKLTEFIEERAHGASALVHTQKWEMETFKFPLPSDLNEQRAIAKTLSDVDALIVGLEKLIAKKRDLKQAAMQQLLTGQTRLPGFSGEWAVKRLGDHFSILKNGVNSRAELSAEGGVAYLHYGDIWAQRIRKIQLRTFAEKSNRET
jgi:type I restriction enzyme S subunit